MSEQTPQTSKKPTTQPTKHKRTVFGRIEIQIEGTVWMFEQQKQGVVVRKKRTLKKRAHVFEFAELVDLIRGQLTLPFEQRKKAKRSSRKGTPAEPRKT